MSSRLAKSVPAPADRKHDRLARAWLVLRQSFVLAWQPTPANVVHWVSWAIALAIEFTALILLRDGHIYAWEREFTEFLQRLPERDLVFTVSNFITNTLSPQFAVLFLLVLAAYLLARQWTAAWLVALTFPLHVLSQFPKALVDRPRPSQYYDGVGGYMSYPSGHAEFVITFYGLMVYLALLRYRSSCLRVAILAAWLVLVVAVGVGRIATGRHWPLDILVSYVVGLGLLSGLIWIERALRAAEQRVQESPR